MEDLGIKALGAFHMQADQALATYKKKLLDTVKGKEMGLSFQDFEVVRSKLAASLEESIDQASEELYCKYPR